jgi:poly-beta-1,6-N-acetyl-D-glucosamine synthase
MVSYLFLFSLFILIAYTVLIFTYTYCFDKAKNYISKNSTPIKITIIVPARNEADNITRCLQAILNQNYSKAHTQIIVVNDQSTDNTANLVAALAPQFELINLLPNTQGGKKNAIAKGVAAATGELIVCTDADCIMPNTWLSTIASFYIEKNASFIAAPVRLVPSFENETKSTAVQIFQTIDFVTLQAITAASVNAKIHNMSNGANMAFSKAAFTAVNGFENIDHIATGDDMLLMQKIFDQFPNQVFYLKTKMAQVSSLTVNSWKQFLQQRIRWSSKATAYTDKKLFYALLLVYATNVISFVLLVSLLFNQTYWVWILVFFIVKTLVEFRLFSKAANYFNQAYLKKWFWFFIPVHILYIIIAGGFGKMGKVTWKDRKQ